MAKANSAVGMNSYKKNPLPKAKQTGYNLSNKCAEGAKIDKLRSKAYSEVDSMRGQGSIG